MPGLSCIKVDYYSENPDIDNLFGFFYCRVEAPINSYLGLLPIITKNGLNFPVGK